MDENSSDSPDSELSEKEKSDSIVVCLNKYKLKISEFSSPNSAKNYAENEPLTPSQTTRLEALTDLEKYPVTSSERFVSIIRELSDIRSFRILFGQQVSFIYDYSLIVLDVYFSNFAKPSICLKTGLEEACLSSFFEESGQLSSSFWSSGLIEVPDPENQQFLQVFIEDLHSALFMCNNQVNHFEEAEIVPLNHLVRFGCMKFGVLEMLKNPLPEFYEAIRAYFIIFKQNLKMELEIHSVEPGEKVVFPKNSLTCIKNQKLVQKFEEFGYSHMQAEVFNEIKALLDTLPSPAEEFGLDFGNSAPVILTEASQNDPQPPESRTLYFQTLKDNRFSIADFWSKKKHILAESISSEGAPNTNRLSKEVKVLSQHLPCETTGAIFVVMDSERMDLMKALISGSEDTPYTHGLYEFHIACPLEYPKKPPLVSIVTTGNGKVRFNPNLYDDGYVCLSVINTWDGDPSERWNPAHSNILQVLLSIQVLVMDNMIIQKEPEFEHLTENSWENKMYCNIVKYNNVKHAMLGMLENPPEEFKEVIWKHFALKRNAIMTTVDKWLEEAKEFVTPNDGEIDYLVMDHNPHSCNLFKSYSYYSILLEARNELLKKLDSLPSLGIEKQEFSLIEITEDLAKLGGYYKKMNGFMLCDKELAEAGGYRHSLGMYLGSFKKYKEKVDRFTKEKEFLSQLKCLPNSSIFIVRDTERWDLLKVLISGPIGTDYANGLFLFDVACTEDFPNSPPRIQLLTTGRFSTVFHPRLASNGDVLGLNWDSASNLAEFFVQVQDIFKQSHSVEHLDIRSCIIRYNTLAFAILDMIRHPPIDFAPVVPAHFEIKKRDILLQAESWIDESSSIEDLNGKVFDNLATLDIFSELSATGALETVYSEIVEAIGDVIGDEWSDCSEKEVKEKKPKKIKNLKKYSSSECENESVDEEKEQKKSKKNISDDKSQKSDSSGEENKKDDKKTEPVHKSSSSSSKSY